MKKLIIYLVLLLTLIGCSMKGKTPFDNPELKPDAFCDVIQKPDPLLMGTREGRFTRAEDWADLDKNYIKYKLIKYDDKYALYFYRTWHSGKRKVREWKKWSINGKEITGDFGVRIFVQGGNVLFTMRGVKEPAQMLRVEN